ncbi:MAG: hypothetical protein ACLFM0_06255 [Spirochaetales bacterium]
MRLSSGLLVAGSVWECIRFALIGAGVFGFAAGVSGDYASVIWFASPQLIIAGVLVMIALYPSRYRRMVKVVVLGKALAVVSGIAAAVSTLFGGIGGVSFTAEVMVVLLVIFGDLLLLSVLLFLDREPPRK